MLFFSSVYELKDKNVYEKQKIENDQKQEKLDSELSQSDAHFRRGSNRALQNDIDIQALL